MQKGTKQTLQVAVALHISLWSNACCVLLPPFYPELAETRNISPVTYGLVFTIFKAFCFLGAILSHFVSLHISTKTRCVLSLIGFCASEVGIASLYWIINSNIFLILSFVFASLSGIFLANLATSSFSVVNQSLSQKEWIGVPITDVIFGFGCIIGSGASGPLVELWAFPLPFFVLSSILIMALPLIIWQGDFSIKADKNEKPTCNGDNSNKAITITVEKELVKHKEIKKEPKNKTNHSKMLLNATFLINMITVLSSGIALTYNEPTLAPHLDEILQLTPAQVSTGFTIQYLFYGVGSLLCGFFSRLNADIVVILFGKLLCAASFLLIGPAQITGLQLSETLVYASLALLGLGVSGQFTTASILAIKTTKKHGIVWNAQVSDAIANWIWTFYYIGTIVAPEISAFMVAKLGYTIAANVIVCLFLIDFLLYAIFLIAKLCLRVTGYDVHVAIEANVTKLDCNFHAGRFSQKSID